MLQFFVAFSPTVAHRQVCVTGRNEDALRKVAADIGGSYVVADLTEDDACRRVVEEAVISLGGLTTLVNRCLSLARAHATVPGCFKVGLSAPMRAALQTSCTT